ncbi:MAG: acetyltransferase [Lewinellaceae bacterium]|nr:acetyltransferase [Lewinellaceae bacterium]
MELILRPALPADLPLLRRWDEQPHIIASDLDDWGWEVELARNPPWREQLIAELAGRPIGFVQLIDPQEEETHYWGDIGPNKRALDIWIGMAEDLGQGYGTRMMALALERCFQHASVEEVLIDPLTSNTRAIRFYQRLGFEFVEERTFYGDHCQVFRLTREGWEHTKREAANTGH